VKKARVYLAGSMLPQGIEILNKHCEVLQFKEQRGFRREDLFHEDLKSSEAVIVMPGCGPIDEEVFDYLSNMKVIATHSVGLDHFSDLGLATARKITVGYTPHALTHATAEQALALMFVVARGLFDADRSVRDGRWANSKGWRPDENLGGIPALNGFGLQIHGSTLGIVGLGRIGKAMARKCNGLGMRVIAYDPYVSSHAGEAEGVTMVETLDQLLGEADVVSLHCAQTDETRHLIGSAELKKMRKEAILINVSRGGVVDSDALRESLNSDEIAGAAIDVTHVEPLSVDDPLLQAKNLVIAPHIASATERARSGMGVMTAWNIILGLQRRRLWECANEEVYAALGI
jgi:phosphoglycerate dehydrogenase-like enzyme